MLITAALAAGQQPQTAGASKTKIVLLGTGTPAPDLERSGPATAIVVNDTAYLVDLGPGIVRRAAAAFFDKDIKELEPTKLRVAFVTHLHSDHTVGYPDLIFTPWTVGRRVPLEVYGPKGLKAMTEHLLEAYRVDIETRTNVDGNQRGFPEGHKVNAHEITPGVIYKDANVTVTAFVTKHAMESYGYRFDTPDRSIVISGDTNPTQATIDTCRGCDVLIHEAHYTSVAGDAARDLPAVCRQVPHNDASACRACTTSKAKAAHSLSLCGLVTRRAVRRYARPLFGTLRCWSRPRYLLNCGSVAARHAS